MDKLSDKEKEFFKEAAYDYCDRANIDPCAPVDEGWTLRHEYEAKKLQDLARRIKSLKKAGII